MAERDLSDRINRMQLREQMMAAISSEFLSLEGPGIDPGLEGALQKLGRFCALQRATVFQIHGDGERVSATHEWCAPQEKPLKAAFQNAAFSAFGALRGQVDKGESWVLRDAAAPDAPAMEGDWAGRGSHARLAWPLRYKNLSLGFLLFERAGSGRAWTDHDLESARQSADLMAQLLARQRGESALRLSEMRLRAELEQRMRQDKDHEKLLANLLAIFNAGSQAIILVSREMTVEAFNQHAFLDSRQMFNRDIQAGHSIKDYLPPGQLGNFTQAFSKCLQGEEIRHNREVQAFDGKIRRLHIEYLPVFSEDGAVRSVCCSYESLEEIRLAELALQESEERYALAARGSHDGLWDWNLLTGKMYFSDRWCEMLGIEPAMGPSGLDAWAAMLHPEDREGFRSRMDAHLRGQTSHFECEARVLHRGTGDYSWMLWRGMAVRESPGSATRVAGSQTDISLRKRAEGRQELAALSDPLTGLPNRSVVLDRIGRSLARKLRRQGYLFAVLLLDTDNFKAVNDSLGHELGDELLVAVARRLEALLRPGDTVGRLGGDEFALLLEDLGSSRDALAIVERIHDELKPVFQIRGKDVFISVSVGLAMSGGDYHQAEELLRDAETAMYQSKALGPSQHLIFDGAMHRQAVKRLEMETELRKAVEERSFVLYYQPLVRLSDGAAYGFEALLRWLHPRRGMIAPTEFIPLAEETRQIIPLGRFVVQEACRQMADWARAGWPELSMNVNVSVAQLRHEALASEVGAALRQHSIDPSRLTLEITESVLMDNPAAAAQAFEKLKALGVKLAIDDFGTGYSSLSYLQRFPVDTLKIDRSFVSQMDGLPENEAISSAIITMGKNLKIAVVAEGVENQVQKERLSALGCLQGQGFYFSRPVEANEAFKRLLKA